jgi:hypothetical protein
MELVDHRRRVVAAKLAVMVRANTLLDPRIIREIVSGLA